MARPTIPAAVLAQRGRGIKLIDGAEVRVCFTFSSLMRLEEKFGSVQGALTEINKGEGGKAFTSIAEIMASGLEHEIHGPDGVPLSNVDYLRNLLDPYNFTGYSDALGEALSAAFPSAQDESTGGDDADPTKDSRGESGTTSQPSPSDAVNTSSGTA